MQLISLDLENFRQHRKAAIEFGGGITGVIGKNGSGKTTLLEAIAWALYGAPAVRGKNADIRCRASEGNQPVEVSLTFSLEGQTYSVTRRLDSQGRPQGAALAINGQPSRTGFSEVTDSIAKILGMDYRAFFNSFFTAQKQLDFMAGMDGRSRAEAIGKMLGYERLTRARERANQDRLGLQREIEGLERGLPDPESLKARKEEAKKRLEAAGAEESVATEKLKTADADVTRLTPLKEASEQKARRYEELSRRIESDSKDAARAQSRIQQLSVEIADLEGKEKEAGALQDSVAAYTEAEKEYRRLGELQKHEAERHRITGQLEAVDRDVEQLQKQIVACGGAKEALASAEQSVHEVEVQLKEAEDRIAKASEDWIARKQRLAADAAAHRRSIDDILRRRGTIVDAGSDGKCPTCERPLGDELAKVLAGFDAQAEKERERLAKIEESAAREDKEPAELSAARTLHQALQKTLAERRTQKDESARRALDLASAEEALTAKNKQAEVFKRQLAALPKGFDQRRYDELRQLGAELRPKRDRAIKLETELARLPVLRKERDQESAFFADKSAGIAEAKKSLEELAFSQPEHERLLIDFGKASDALASARLEVERRRGEVKAAQATLTAVKAEEESYRAKQAELTGKREQRLYLHTLAEAFDALRIQLNSQIRPELEEAASEVLTALTDGRYSMVEIDEDYEAWIVEDGERKQIISGGETDVLNLALRLAISQMIAGRSGHPLSLLVLDEVFGSLDDSRRDNVMSLLANLRSRFEQIILITHIESIHDAVDNCIWVEFDEQQGVSRLLDGRPEKLTGFSLES